MFDDDRVSSDGSHYNDTDLKYLLNALEKSSKSDDNIEEATKANPYSQGLGSRYEDEIQ